ncbi:MAG: allantoinase AllB [Kineosporiaceae bacterium]
MTDLVIRARRAVLPDGERPATVVVRDGTVAAVESFAWGDGRDGTVTLAEDEVLLPGLVDTHVHCNEPGRTHWEGFATATRAAAAGGITTIVDMPLNSIPPTTTADALAVKRAAAAGQVHVDVGFWGGAVPGNAEDLPALLDAGAFGAKCFLCPSGVEEFGHLDGPGLDLALARLATRDGLLLVHAEDPAVLDAAARPAGTRFTAFVATRPAAAEAAAVARVVEGLRRVRGGRAHIVHVAAAEAVEVIRAAQAEGLALTGETCPHYLALDTAAVPDAAPQYKCCPPVRDPATRDALWAAVADGTLGIVVSDHSPAPADLKHLDTGDLDAAWGGIASVQVSLPVVWTEARRRGHGLGDVVRWMAAGPADLAGLPRKGRIAVGADADLCVLAPDEQWVVDPAALHHRHPVTPYAGIRLHGVVRATYLRGEPVTGDRPSGRLIWRGAL